MGIAEKKCAVHVFFPAVYSLVHRMQEQLGQQKDDLVHRLGRRVSLRIAHKVRGGHSAYGADRP